MFRIVDTDNYGRDYPDERFLSKTDSDGKSYPLQFTNDAQARQVADVLNGPIKGHKPRWWKVVHNDYVLQPGFEP